MFQSLTDISRNRFCRYGEGADPPTYSSSLTYPAGSIVQDANHNYFRAAKSNKGQALSNANAWRLYFLQGTLTLNAASPGSPFPTFSSAWTYIADAHFSSTAQLVISVGSISTQYTENFTSPLTLNHPFGSQITINGAGPNHVVFQFNNDPYSGIFLDSGHTLGNTKFAGISGIRFFDANPSAQSVGINVTGGANLHLVNCEVDGFATALEAQTQSRLFCNNVGAAGFTNSVGVASINSLLTCSAPTSPGYKYLGLGIATNGFISGSGSEIFLYPNVWVDGVSASAYWADHASKILADQTQASNAMTGYIATHGSSISADAAIVTHMLQGSNGFFAMGNSAVNANNSSCDTTMSAYVAVSRGYLQAQNSKATNFSVYGYYAVVGGYIDALGSPANVQIHTDVNNGSIITFSSSG
jgi:hypothetical protein